MAVDPGRSEHWQPGQCLPVFALGDKGGIGEGQEDGGEQEGDQYPDVCTRHRGVYFRPDGRGDRGRQEIRQSEKPGELRRPVPRGVPERRHCQNTEECVLQPLAEVRRVRIVREGCDAWVEVRETLCPGKEEEELEDSEAKHCEKDADRCVLDAAERRAVPGFIVLDNKDRDTPSLGLGNEPEGSLDEGEASNFDWGSLTTNQDVRLSTKRCLWNSPCPILSWKKRNI